jgi:hypothetical protein
MPIAAAIAALINQTCPLRLAEPNISRSFDPITQVDEETFG